MNVGLRRRWWLVIVLLPWAGCSRPERAQEACFRELTREKPGRLVLSNPVSCTETVARYRVEGRPSRPVEVRYLDAEGNNHLTYRVDYDASGQPVLEERQYSFQPTAYKLYGGRRQLEFGMKKKAELTRIRTHLDPLGRPVKIEKYVGSRRSYRVIRIYGEDRLVSESTFDGEDRLKFRTIFETRDGRRVERMLDGAGKVLMEREVEGREGGEVEALDTSGGGRVQSPGTIRSLDKNVKPTAKKRLDKRRRSK
jgi:hypothetical protein